MSNRLISEILKEPDAYFLLQEVHVALDNEKSRRIAFYNEVTEQEKVEFINGEIIVHSPVMKRHNTSTVLLSRLMSIYTNIHQLGLVGIEKIMIMLTRNDYEPDICFSRKKNQIVLWKIKRYFPLLILSLKYFRKVQKSGIGERPFGAWNFRIIRLTKLKNIVLFTPNTKPLSNIILKRMVMN